MTTAVDDIVKITINRQSAAVSRQTLTVPLIVSAHTNFSTRQKSYSSATILSDLVTDGFSTSDPAYKQASAILRNAVRPSKIIVGKELVGDADITATMAAIEAEDQNAFYGFAYDTRAEQDLLDLGAWAETTNHILIAQSADAAITSETAGNVLEDLEALNYRRTALLPHYPSSEDYADAELLGLMMTGDLDVRNSRIDGAYKTLPGVAADTLTAANRSYIHGLDGNTYERRLGKDIVAFGNMVGGMPIAETIGFDWLDIRMTEDVFAFITSQRFLGYDQAALDGLEGVVRSRLGTAVNNGVLTSFTIDTVAFADVDQSDISAETYKQISFTGFLRRPLRHIEVQGDITV